MDLIQVVPSLPPRLDGIGDYARKLAVALLESHDIRTHFIACKLGWMGGPVDGFKATPLNGHSTAAFIDVVSKIEQELRNEKVPVLVHFAVYGYQERGVPFWLAEALEAVNQRRHGQLHILFHELEAYVFRPWRSVFWLSSLQRRIIRRVALAADYRYTNADVFRSKLEKWGVKRIDVIPNFSTMGEPNEYPSWSNRERSLVIFGQSAQRGRAYAVGNEVLEAVCNGIGVDRVLDVGDNSNITIPERIGSIPVVQCGRLTENDVRETMATSIASFLTYPVSLLPKSSIFAVSRAFGTVPIVYNNTRPESCPSIEAGEDYIPISDKEVHQFPKLSLEELSLRVFRSYQAHRSTRAASVFAANLLQAPVPSVSGSVV